MDISGRGLMIVELLSQECGTRTDDHGFKSVWASFPGTIQRYSQSDHRHVHGQESGLSGRG
jgi:hypothetical protein